MNDVWEDEVLDGLGNRTEERDRPIRGRRISWFPRFQERKDDGGFPISRNIARGER